MGPAVDLLQSRVDQPRQCSLDSAGELCPPVDGLRLDAEHNDFFRSIAGELHGADEIRESQQVHAFGDRQSRNVVPVEAENGSRLDARLHGVERQQARDSGERVQEVEPEGRSVKKQTTTRKIPGRPRRCTK